MVAYKPLPPLSSLRLNARPCSTQKFSPGDSDFALIFRRSQQTHLSDYSHIEELATGVLGYQGVTGSIEMTLSSLFSL